MRTGTIRKKGPYGPSVTSLYTENYTYTVQLLEQLCDKKVITKVEFAYKF